MKQTNQNHSSEKKLIAMTTDGVVIALVYERMLSVADGCKLADI